MLDGAIRIAIPSAVTVCYVEHEIFAASILAARMEDKVLDEAPIWSELGTFDGRPWREIVDIVTASPPCQPYSLAGKKQGNNDSRSWGDGGGPLPHALRIISECRPALVFLENVPAWVRGGWFLQFGDELSRLGYEIEDPLFIAASDVGASHERERVFILCHLADDPRIGILRAWLCEANTGDRREGNRRREKSSGRCSTLADPSGGQLPVPRRGQEGRDGAGSGGADMGESNRQPKCQPNHATGAEPSCGDARGSAGGAGSGLADSRRERLQRQREGGPEAGSTRRSSGATLFAPGPGAIDQWTGVVTDFPCLAPAIEPGIRLLADGVALVVDESRADQLRCGGNGVVAIQAAVAFAVLLGSVGRKIK